MPSLLVPPDERSLLCDSVCRCAVRTPPQVPSFDGPAASPSASRPCWQGNHAFAACAHIPAPAMRSESRYASRATTVLLSHSGMCLFRLLALGTRLRKAAVARSQCCALSHLNGDCCSVRSMRSESRYASRATTVLLSHSGMCLFRLLALGTRLRKAAVARSQCCALSHLNADRCSVR